MKRLFETDAYARHCTARVTAVRDNEICLDQTLFYPTGGGQLGDCGSLTWEGGSVPIDDTRKGETHLDVVHLPRDGAPCPALGEEVVASNTGFQPSVSMYRFLI